jgi:predicted MFS family arabinose efflux permease
MGGPSLGGILVHLFSAPFALLVDAFSFLGSALFLSTIDPVEPPTEEAEGGHVMAGMRFVWGTPILRSALLATATINFFNFIFWALFILYATRSLDVRPGLLGPLLGAASVGGVIGSMVTGRLSRRIGVGPAFAFGCVLFPAPLVLVPLAGGAGWTVFAFLFAAEFLSGLGVMVLDITAASIKAALVPDRLRARIAGAYMVVNYGVRPIGSLAGGALGTWIGLRPTLWIASVGAIAGVLWLLPSPLPRLRELPEVEE